MLKLSGSPHKLLYSTIFSLAFFLTTPGVSQESYHLAYRWAKGQKYQYSVYITGQQTTDEGVQNVRIQYLDLWEVVGEAEARGLHKVAEKCLNYSGTDFDLKSFGIAGKGDLIERMIDPYGRVASVARFGAGSRFYLLPLILPEVPVKLEGKWKLAQQARVPFFEGEAVVEIVVVYTLEGINRNYKGSGRDCARIRVDANYLHESEAGASGVKGAYQGRLFFDIKEKKLIDYQITENRREWITPENRIRNTSLQFTSIARP